MECSHLNQAVKISPQFLQKLRNEKASHWTCGGEVPFALVCFKGYRHKNIVCTFTVDSLQICQESMGLPSMLCYTLWKVFNAKQGVSKLVLYVMLCTRFADW